MNPDLKKDLIKAFGKHDYCEIEQGYLSPLMFKNKEGIVMLICYEREKEVYHEDWAV